MRICRLFWLIQIFCILYATCSAEAAQPQELRQVRLQLKWTHQFQFAGYYAAKAKGYYAEAGIDAVILEGRPDISPTTSVLEGKADFGISNSSLLIERSRGKPVVALAAVFQHSPYIIMARQGANIASPRDLVGKTMMVEEHADELLAYLHAEKVPPNSLKIIPHSGRVIEIGRGQVDAMTAYSTLEPYLMHKQGTPFRVFSPRSSDIDFYGDLLFTTEDLLKRDPALAGAFRKASLKGWRYALDHQSEIIDLMIGSYAPGLDRGLLEFEAKQTALMIAADIIEIGFMSENRWRKIADGFAAAGLMPANFSLKGFLLPQ